MTDWKAIGWAVVAGLCLSAGAVQAMQQKGVKVTHTPEGRKVQFRHLARHHGLTLTQAPQDGPITLSGRGREAVFLPESRKAMVDGVVVWLSRPVARARRHWAVHEVDLVDVLEPIWAPHRHLQTQGYRTIVLDAGHGGKDTGARGQGTLEKDLTLELTHDLARRLEAAGFQVRLTRTRDEFIELSNRCVRATAQAADVFVSLHFNSAMNAEARGVETFVLPPPGEGSTDGGAADPGLAEGDGGRFRGASRVLSHSLQKHLLSATEAPDRGVKQARFVVLRHAPCAAALVELGFLSHPEEEARIRTPSYREALARGLAAGIIDYLRAVKQAHVMAEP